VTLPADEKFSNYWRFSEPKAPLNREKNMELNKHRNAILALVTFAGLTAFAPAARAQVSQIHPTIYGSTEFDTRHSQFYLAGLYLGMGGLGWSPYLNVNGYILHYRPIQSIDATSNLKAISPTIGLAYAGRSGGVSFGGGYTWVSNENPAAPGAESGGKSGVTASFGAYSNGSGRRALRTQLLSNYNFGSHYVWARGRASVPFGYSSRHPARIGAELVGQGGGLNGNTSNSFQVGPTFEYGWTPNFRTTLAGGWKTVGGSGPSFTSGRDNAAYVKLEFSLSP
jgi:hypothetical protein